MRKKRDVMERGKKREREESDHHNDMKNMI
jgi:hypothetical protein